MSPTTAEHVRAGLGTKISYILDGGPARFGLESTIVDLRDPARPRLLRPGVITAAEISRVLGVRLAPRAATPGAARAQVAPGSLRSHYRPRTPLTLHRRLAIPAGRPGEAFVFFRQPDKTGANVFVLKPPRDPRLAGRHLFALLRRLDGAGFGHLHVEAAAGGGVADAINDRLRRAAAK